MRPDGTAGRSAACTRPARASVGPAPSGSGWPSRSPAANGPGGSAQPVCTGVVALSPHSTSAQTITSRLIVAIVTQRPRRGDANAMVGETDGYSGQGAPASVQVLKACSNAG